MTYSLRDAFTDIKNRIAVWRSKAAEICHSTNAVLIFGAGFYGTFLANHILPEGGAKGIIDNNPLLRGLAIHGLTVGAFAEYADRYPGARVLISVANDEGRKAIWKQCVAEGLHPCDFCPESFSSGLPPFIGSHAYLWLRGRDNPNSITDEDGGDYAPLDDFIGSGCLVSHSDACEDAVFLEYLYPIKQGCYIDVGCADPVNASATKMFYDFGWNGINIDPRSPEIEKYATARPRDINLALGVSDSEGDLPFWEAGSFSTFNPERVEHCGSNPVFNSVRFMETRVPVTTLDSVIARHIPGKAIHFLKIDAETHEKQVLEGLNLRHNRPWMIMVESPSMEIKSLLADNDYVLVRDIAYNTFYVSKEKERELLNNYLAKPVFFLIRHEHARAIRKMTALHHTAASCFQKET